MNKLGWKSGITLKKMNAKSTGDDETRSHSKTNQVHFRKASPFAAQQLAHFGRAFSPAVPE
jgi:hypothetical protein